MTRRAIVLLLLFAACSPKGSKKEMYQNMTATGGGNADRGRKLVQQYGCTSCHVIPGVSGPQGEVGPPLQKMATRQFIAGKFPNTPQNMMKWIQNPQSMDPQNAMPNLSVTPADSRDITAYLMTLK